ncbi:MAG: CoA transferase subunit A [Deltaproteobacteria bacterium]|nr:CoA transferase subunit A [Deltaproteobacteria bacterium]
MKSAQNKITTLKEAIALLVQDNCHLSIGGFTINRNPMAAVYEIIRQGRKGLHLYAHSNGQGVDELIGAGCVARLDIAYAGSGRFAPTCVRFRRAVENGELLVEDYSNYQMTLRFMAGAMGLPFLPTRSGLGTDIIKRWGFSKDLREEDQTLPEQKLVTIDNPFGNWGDTPKLVLVPAINPDVTIIHVQQADQRGNARIQGLTFADIEQAKAARHLIITCEELVAEDFLKRDSDRNQIPFFHVDAVVPVAWGAYPTACYQHYDYDPHYLNHYRQAAEDDADYRSYLAEKITGTADHQHFLELNKPEHLQSLVADPETGYATGLERNQ